MGILVRQETPTDYAEIYALVQQAFATAEHKDGDEQDLVVKLRGSAAFVPELSLVAEINGRLVGYILFTKAKVGNQSILVLAPLAVLPQYQRQGIGKELIKAGEKIAEKLEFSGISVIGNPQVYGKSGYASARKFGISSPFEIDDKYFMFKELCLEPFLGAGAVIEYAPEFGI